MDKQRVNIIEIGTSVTLALIGVFIRCLMKNNIVRKKFMKNFGLAYFIELKKHKTIMIMLL